MSCFYEICINNFITGVPTEESVCNTSHCTTPRINYLVQQDTQGKCLLPYMNLGAWAGAMCYSVPGVGILVTCSNNKLLKGSNWISICHKEGVFKRAKYLDYNKLEIGCGFLVQFSSTFTVIFAYLKVLYNTINLWIILSNMYGWKYSMIEWKLLLSVEEASIEDVNVANKGFV